MHSYSLATFALRTGSRCSFISSAARRCRPSVPTMSGPLHHHLAAGKIRYPPILLHHVVCLADYRSFSDQPKRSTLPKSNHRDKEQNRGKNYLRLPLDRCQNIDQVLQLAIQHIDPMPPNQVAAVWSYLFQSLQNASISREMMSRYEAMDALLRRTIDLLDKASKKDVTTIVLFMAKIVKNIQRASDRGRLNIYQQALRSLLLDGSSNPKHDIFKRCCEAIDQKLHTFDARYLSNAAYACALLGYYPRLDGNNTLMENIAERSIQSFRQFNAQDVSNLLWSFATLKVPSPLLFKVFGDTLSSQADLNKFSSQSLSNIVWAYGTTRTQHSDLFQKIGDFIVALDDLHSFKPQALSIIAWAFVKTNEEHPKLYKKIGDHISQLDNFSSFNAQNLSNIVWAYAKADTPHPQMFDKVGYSIIAYEKSQQFEPQNLANIAWAYAKLDARHPLLFKKIEQSIAAKDDFTAFSSQHLANIAWAYAKFNIDAPMLFNDRFMDEFVRRKDEFDSNELEQLYLWHVWQTRKRSNSGLPEPLRELCCK